MNAHANVNLTDLISATRRFQSLLESETVDGVSLREFVDYWEDGNDQYLTDKLNKADLRRDLALFSEVLKRMIDGKEPTQ